MILKSFASGWFVGVAAIVIGAVLMSFVSPEPSQRNASLAGFESAAPGEADRQIVCLGYVDLAGGVAALTTSQPSRVTAVLAKENQHVAAGTRLLTTDDRASCQAVEEAKAALLAAMDRLENARVMTKRHEIQVEKQKAAILGVRARLAAASCALELKQNIHSLHDAEVRVLRARLEAAKRGFELKQNLKSLNQANDKEVAVAEQLVKECEAAVEAELGSAAGEKNVAIAQQQVKEYEAAADVELAALAELDLVDPQHQARQMEADVQRAQATLAQAQAILESQHVLAPAAGTVLRIMTRPGEVISAASPAMLFAPEGPRIVRAEAEQVQANRLAVGATAAIRDDVVRDREWSGKVLQLADWYSNRRRILEETTTFTDVPTVECLISIDEKGPPPRIGQRVRVYIDPAKNQAERQDVPARP